MWKWDYLEDLSTLISVIYGKGLTLTFASNISIKKISSSCPFH